MAGRGVARPGVASAEASPGMLERNLAALAIGSPEVVRAVSEAGPRVGAGFAVSEDGLLTGWLVDASGARRSLGSGRRPGEEADRLAGRVDLEKAAVVVVMGFALGHHVRSILERARSSALLVVYEPDVALLREVLSRQDHAGWLCDPLIRFVTDAGDSVALSRVLEGSEGLVSLGLEIVSHPPSVARLGSGADLFASTLTDAVRAIRTTVITTLAQADVTIRNQLMNLDAYAGSEGIEPLRGVCAGRPAIVVSAGPSVHRNLPLLAEPGVRERFVLIAVQTMLKPMLELGIRPHFVTALDYHEISTRFYEGLTAADVEGVTLVAEAKGNAAIFAAWPGRVRCPADGFLDPLLAGSGVTTGAERGAIRAGSTVAHLAYYLARHLGCDPVALIGQDLGFTDGQYYGDGAAIHRVWGAELNEFCTLETLEWQRIKRMGTRLMRAVDHLGRPVFTDEQMHTYRQQFERDFAADEQAGRTTIDATEGGVAKRSTVVLTLREVLDGLGGGEVVLVPEAPPLNRGEPLRCAVGRLREVRRDVHRVETISRSCGEMLEEMIEHADDQARVNRLIARVHAQRDEVKALEPAWSLVHAINQRGTYRRAQADRRIHLSDEGDPYARQRAQMARDAENLDGLVSAAEALGSLMDAAIRAHEGRSAKLTRETPRLIAASARSSGGDRPAVWAAVTVDPDRSDLGVARDLTRPVVDGKAALRLTLERLARVRGLAGLALATANRGLTARAAGIDPAGGMIEGVRVRIVEVDDEPIRDRADAIRGARLPAARCWRGGIGGWSYADEVVYPDALLAILRETGASALLVAGADWCLVDPGLGAGMIERFAESPETNRLVFSQAAVGLSPVLLERSLIESIHAKRADAGSFASVGALLGYVPVQPTNDPIAGSACVRVPPAVRDLGERVTLDTPERIAAWSPVLASGADGCSLEDLVHRVAARAVRPSSPEHLVLELIDGAGRELSVDRAVSLVREAAGARPDLCVTLTGHRGLHSVRDALRHLGWMRILGAARGAGVAWVHLRTPGLDGPGAMDAALRAGFDALSLDLIAGDAALHELLSGEPAFEASRAAFRHAVEARNGMRRFDGVPSPWLVARLTRRDAVYEQVDELYDRWLLACGAAVLDPLPEAIPGERIAPLAVPGPTAARLAHSVALVTASGTWQGGTLRDGLLAAWRSAGQGMHETARRPSAEVAA
ncbi:MAG: 6-hydroxymethylpterin diphosphokinase MptE-like protein [Phycisphaerales bacterium]